MYDVYPDALEKPPRTSNLWKFNKKDQNHTIITFNSSSRLGMNTNLWKPELISSTVSFGFSSWHRIRSLSIVNKNAIQINRLTWFIISSFFRFLPAWKSICLHFLSNGIFDSSTISEEEDWTKNHSDAIYLSSLSLPSHSQGSNKHISFASIYICLFFFNFHQFLLWIDILRACGQIGLCMCSWIQIRIHIK